MSSWKTSWRRLLSKDPRKPSGPGPLRLRPRGRPGARGLAGRAGPWTWGHGRQRVNHCPAALTSTCPGCSAPASRRPSRQPRRSHGVPGLGPQPLSRARTVPAPAPAPGASRGPPPGWQGECQPYCTVAMGSGEGAGTQCGGGWPSGEAGMPGWPGEREPWGSSEPGPPPTSTGTAPLPPASEVLTAVLAQAPEQTPRTRAQGGWALSGQTPSQPRPTPWARQEGRAQARLRPQDS